MTIKQTILTLTVGLIAATTNGQSIKSYFIPDVAYNKVSFYSPDENGLRSEESTRVIYYTKNEDNPNNYEILDAHFFEEKPISIFTRIIHFSDSVVTMIKSISTSALGETMKKTNYNPPIILLKIPPLGQSVTWRQVEHPNSGDKPTKYIASWTTFTINGESRKAIKLISQYTGWEGKTITYYVKGIGLIRTEISADGKTIIEDKFDGISYDDGLQH